MKAKPLFLGAIFFAVAVPLVEAEQMWRAAEELVKLGFERSRVVMMNEAHSGLLRSVRTRRMGKRVLAAAHAQGVRHIAMEALYPEFAEQANKTRKAPKSDGYLGQPEMVSFIQEALNLGWTLVPYEARRDKTGVSSFDRNTNWREEQQARNLVSALAALPDNAKLFVWCGNGHHLESVLEDWIPMGYRFAQLSGLDPFTIDQSSTVEFRPGVPNIGSQFLDRYAKELDQMGGTMGFLKEEAPKELARTAYDAFLLSTDNRLE